MSEENIPHLIEVARQKQTNLVRCQLCHRPYFLGAGGLYSPRICSSRDCAALWLSAPRTINKKKQFLSEAEIETIKNNPVKVVGLGSGHDVRPK